MAYPNLKQAIWLLVLFTLIQVVLVVLAAAAGRWLFESEFLSVILFVVSFIIILRYVNRRADLTWKDISQSFNVDFDWRVWPCVTISIVGMAMVLFRIGQSPGPYNAYARVGTGYPSFGVRARNIFLVCLTLWQLLSDLWSKRCFIEG